MKRAFSIVLALITLMLPINSLANMYGSLKGNTRYDIERKRPELFYAAMDQDTGLMYFCVRHYPVSLVSSIYQYHPSQGFHWITNIWNFPSCKIKAMIVCNNKIYYSLYSEWDAAGFTSLIYAYDMTTGWTTPLLHDERTLDLLAAGDDSILVYMEGWKTKELPLGIYRYSLESHQLSALDLGEFEKFFDCEAGLTLKREDGSIDFFSYAEEKLMETDLKRTDNDPVRFLRQGEWVEQPGILNYSFFVRNKQVWQINYPDSNFVAYNDKYAVWFAFPKEPDWSYSHQNYHVLGRQRINALDLYASADEPKATQYDVDVYSNIFILDHYAVMRSSLDKFIFTLIDLQTGEVSIISP